MLARLFGSHSTEKTVIEIPKLSVPLRSLCPCVDNGIDLTGVQFQHRDAEDTEAQRSLLKRQPPHSKSLHRFLFEQFRCVFGDAARHRVDC
jgi:hypothetical protein